MNEYDCVANINKESICELAILIDLMSDKNANEYENTFKSIYYNLFDE